MDVVVYALCKKLVKDAIESIGEAFSIKGNLFSYDDLPLEGNKNGDVYLVGPKLDGSYDEYYWSSLERWESMGSTLPDMSSYISDMSLYSGLDQTGSITDPAEDTILYTVYQLMKDTYVEKQDGYSLVADEEISKLEDLPADAMSEEEATLKFLEKTKIQFDNYGELPATGETGVLYCLPDAIYQWDDKEQDYAEMGAPTWDPIS